MRCIDRYEEYHSQGFDKIILDIRKGVIKAGRYAHMVKIDKKKIIKDKELFTNGREED